MSGEFVYVEQVFIGRARFFNIVLTCLVNEVKIKDMLASSRIVKYNELVSGNYISEAVKEFLYFDNATNSNNDAYRMIHRRITTANRAYYRLSRQLGYRAVSRQT